MIVLITFDLSYGWRNSTRHNRNIFVGIMKEKTKLSTLNFLMILTYTVLAANVPLLQETLWTVPCDWVPKCRK
jgi:hypothetical protein